MWKNSSVGVVAYQSAIKSIQCSKNYSWLVLVCKWILKEEGKEEEASVY